MIPDIGEAYPENRLPQGGRQCKKWKVNGSLVDTMTVNMRMGDGGIELVTGNGSAVARLSRAAEAVWRSRIGEIEAITVIALVRRRIEDAAPSYRGRLRCEWWEVPVVEAAVGRRTRRGLQNSQATHGRSV